PRSSADVKTRKQSLIDHGASLAKDVGELQRFLYEHVYRHPKLLELSRHAAEVLAGLFAALVARPEEMPPWYRRWVGEVGRERAVGASRAGMTDRFAEQEFERRPAHAPAWRAART